MGKVNLHLLAVVKRQERWLQRLSTESEQRQFKYIKWYVAAFHNGARHSINANKPSWLSLDIAQFSCLSHANASDCEYTSVGVFNVPAVKTSSVNRQPSTICFFMNPGLIVSNLLLPFASYSVAALRGQLWNRGLTFKEPHPLYHKRLKLSPIIPNLGLLVGGNW